MEEIVDHVYIFFELSIHQVYASELHSSHTSHRFFSFMNQNVAIAHAPYMGIVSFSHITVSRHAAKNIIVISSHNISFTIL